MVEGFGLLTIIVLGEVVVGVVDALSEVALDFRTMATGRLGLGIGFGFWLLALVLLIILSSVWLFAFSRQLRSEH